MAFADFAGRGRPSGGGASMMGGGGGAAAAAGGGGGAAGAKTPSLRPLTIKQLLSARRIGDGALIVDDREIAQVSIMGRVVSVESASATAATAKSNSYLVTDGSGAVTVRQWVDAMALPTAAFEANSYVHCVGTVKIYQDKVIITGSVRVVMDSNALTFHFLDCILTHLRNTRGEPPAEGGAGGGGGGYSSGYADAAAPSSTGAYGAPTSFGLSPGLAGSLTPIERSVLHAVQSTPRNIGIHVGGILNHVVAEVGPTVNRGMIDNALKKLVDQGTMFTMGPDIYAY